jgi:hypothetical protein
MKKTSIYRHGEIAFREISSLPTDLKPSKDKVIVKGYNGNPHTFKGGEFYPKIDGENIIGYFKADDTFLLHREHGDKVGNKELRQAKLPNGLYEVRKQVEIVNEEMRPVKD